MGPINQPGGTQDNQYSTPEEKRQDSDTTDKILKEAQKLLKEDFNKLVKDLDVVQKDLQIQRNHMKQIDNLLSPTLSPEDMAALESELNKFVETNPQTTIKEADSALEALEKELNEELAKSAEAKKAKSEAETEKIIEEFIVLDKTPDDTKIPAPSPNKGIRGVFKKFFG